MILDVELKVIHEGWECGIAEILNSTAEASFGICKITSGCLMPSLRWPHCFHDEIYREDGADHHSPCLMRSLMERMALRIRILVSVSVVASEIFFIRSKLLTPPVAPRMRIAD